MLLFGNQPDTLYRIFPEAVFKMGFTARVFFIYAPYRVRKKIWLEEHEENRLDNTLYKKLIAHLVSLSQWAGELQTTKGFREAANDFEHRDPCPVPGSRFEHWNSGRGLNTQKLAMCLAASANEKVVTLAHWEKAIEYLFEAEQLMPKIFDNVTTDRGFSEDLEAVIKLFVTVDTITQFTLLKHLSRTRPPYEAASIIDQALRAGAIKQVYDEAGAPARPLQYKLGEIEIG